MSRPRSLGLRDYKQIQEGVHTDAQLVSLGWDVLEFLSRIRHNPHRSLEYVDLLRLPKLWDKQNRPEGERLIATLDPQEALGERYTVHRAQALMRRLGESLLRYWRIREHHARMRRKDPEERSIDYSWLFPPPVWNRFSQRFERPARR